MPVFSETDVPYILGTQGKIKDKSTVAETIEVASTDVDQYVLQMLASTALVQI